MSLLITEPKKKKCTLEEWQIFFPLAMHSYFSCSFCLLIFLSVPSVFIIFCFFISHFLSEVCVEVGIKLNGTSLDWCLHRNYLRRKLWGWPQASLYLFGLHLSFAVSMSEPEVPFICFFSAHILRFHSVWARSWTDWGSGLRSGESASGSRVSTAYTKRQTQGISLPFPSTKKYVHRCYIKLRTTLWQEECFKCQYLSQYLKSRLSCKTGQGKKRKYNKKAYLRSVHYFCPVN